ncbi:MAG: glycoside hydrolase [Chitinivibrionales bacterium]|nr:glycoside hydrolase [Chitinivibrionales bacterium]MBD3357382.1 glycoside hydrolase [Chitinivibrionales bacterium]
MPKNTVNVNLSAPTTPTTRSGVRCIGAGRANEVLRADLQDHLALATSACGFEYIRFHGLLHDDMGVYMNDRTGTPLMSFNYIDACYDALLDIGIRPFVEFSFTPLLLARGDKSVFWWKGNVTLPNDLSKWKELIGALMHHWIRRYGRHEVRQWYFECWNEPNHRNFFDGSMEEYFSLYDVTAHAVKEADSECRVGGPATAGPNWAAELINYCHTHTIPLDFISCHHYGVSQGDGLDEFGRNEIFVLQDKENFPNAVSKVKSEIENSPMPELELHFTEWNTSYSPRDNIHDSYYNAAYILDVLARVSSSVDSMSYWALSDIFEEPGPVQTPFHGGFGLINAQGLRKPTFFVHQFLNRLLPETVPCDNNGVWATKSEDRVALLLWDHTFMAQKVSNQKFFTQDLPPSKLPDAQLLISGLGSGGYTFNAVRVGYRSNDVFAAYYDLGRPNHLTREDTAALDAAANGAPLMHERVVVGGEGVWERTLPMRTNDIWFVELVRS